MRVLIIHDRYQVPPPSGETAVVQRERALLEAHGAETRLLEWELAASDTSLASKAWTQLCGIYSKASYNRVSAAIAEFRPDVVHVHSFWPRATPAAHYACRAAGVAVVQTLHNSRILCANDINLRDGRLCELCVDSRFPWHAVRHRCVRGSLPRSAIVAASFGAHRFFDTWNRTVDVFIAPTRSVRERFIRGGIDAERIVVKPQSAPDGGVGPSERSYFLFAGRLSSEKGIASLLAAWEGCGDIELRIAGVGPFEEQVHRAATQLPNVRYLGALAPQELATAMQHAVATIVPSLWEEPFPLIIAESYAAATPVIAADVGTRAETVTDGETGLIFAAGDVDALRRAVRWAFENPAALRQMGSGARQRYETLYSEDAAWSQLASIYVKARAAADARGRLK